MKKDKGRMNMYTHKWAKGRCIMGKLKRQIAFILALSILGTTYGFSGKSGVKAATATEPSYFDGGTIHIVQTPHTDLGFHESYETDAKEDVTLVCEALDLMKTDPDFIYQWEDMVILDEFVQFRPERLNELFDAISSGRLTIGSTYAQPYETLLGAELYTRQLYFGKKLFEDAFSGAKSAAAYQVDTPMRGLQTAQILHKAGVNGLVLSRYYSQIPDVSDMGVQKWNSPDGSSVNSWSMGHYGVYAGSTLTIEDIKQKVDYMEPYYRSRALPKQLAIYMSADSWRPRSYAKEIAAWNEWAKQNGYPLAKYSTMDEMLQAFNDEIKPAEVMADVSGQATAEASSQFDDGSYAAQNVTGSSGEWACKGEQTPWIKLSWDSPQTISKLVLTQRGITLEWVKSAKLSFSDGSEIVVDGMESLGQKTISFSERTVDWVKLSIESCIDTAQNPGMARIEIYGKQYKAPDIDQINGERPNLWLYEGAPDNHQLADYQKKGANQLVAVEAFQTFRALEEGSFQNYPQSALDAAWKNLSFACHGWQNQPLLDTYMSKYKSAYEQSGSLLNDTYAWFASRVKSKAEGIPLVVFNPLAQERNDSVTANIPANAPASFILKDGVGNEIPYQKLNDQQILFIGEKIPSMGYKTYYLSAGTPKAATMSPKSDWTTQYENSYYQVEPGKSGVKSIYDKTLGKQLLDTTNYLGGEMLELSSPGQGAGEFTTFPGPVDTVSSTATVEVSSEYSADYAGNKAIDGNLGTDWASKQEKTPWIKLTFPQPVEVSGIQLVQRVMGDEYIDSGVLEFDDGTQIEMKDMQTKTINRVYFESRPVKWVKFSVKTSMETAINVGLSEFVVLSDQGTVRSSTKDSKWVLAQSGPVRDTFTCDVQMDHFSYQLRMHVYKTIKKIDFDLDVKDWDGTKNKELRLAFPINSTEKNVVYDTAYGISQIGKDEVNPERAGWGDLAQPREIQNYMYAGGDGFGVTFSTDVAVNDYVDVRNPENPQTIFQPVLLATRQACGSGDFWTQEGDHSYAFSLTSHQADVKHAAANGPHLNQPLAAVAGRSDSTGNLPDSQSYLTLSSPDIALSAVKKAQDSNNSAILRAYNLYGEEVSCDAVFTKDIRKAQKTDLIERPTGTLSASGKNVTVQFGPRSIETGVLQFTEDSFIGTPTDLSAKSLSNGKAIVTWQPVDTADGYIIRLTDAVTGEAKTFTPKNGFTAYLLDALQSGKKYYVQIAAKNDTLTGNYAAPVAFGGDASVESLALYVDGQKTSTLTLKEGASVQLELRTYTAEGAGKTPAYTSDKPETVSVDAAGKISALKAGTAVVTAKIDGVGEVKCIVTVQSEEPEKADKSELNAAIAVCKQEKADEYTAESWAPFAKALADAEAVAADENAVQQQVDEAWKALNAAKAALKKKETVIHPVKNGWDLQDDIWYYYENDRKVTGWKMISGKWYLLGADGAMKTGWQKSSGKWYFLESSGKMATGWKMISGKWYLLGADGAMKTGWQKLGGKWYFLESSGKMATGWKFVSGKWYLLGLNGAMKTGWQKSGGKWYFLESSGKMATGWKFVSGKWYLLGSNGAMKTGWQKSGGKWYFLESSGKMATGWKKIANKWYFMNGSGQMLSSLSQRINGKVYRFNAQGICLNP